MVKESSGSISNHPQNHIILEFDETNIFCKTSIHIYKYAKYKNFHSRVSVTQMSKVSRKERRSKITRENPIF